MLLLRFVPSVLRAVQEKLLSMIISRTIAKPTRMTIKMPIRLSHWLRISHMKDQWFAYMPSVCNDGPRIYKMMDRLLELQLRQSKQPTPCPEWRDRCSLTCVGGTVYSLEHARVRVHRWGRYLSRTNLATPAYTQLLVATRLLDSVQDRVAKVSRLRRIYPCDVQHGNLLFTLTNADRKIKE